MKHKLNLCVDCKYYRELDEKCLYETKTNPVNGEVSFYHAITQRESYSSCGMSGQWFSPIRMVVDDFDDLDQIPFGMKQ